MSWATLLFPPGPGPVWAGAATAGPGVRGFVRGVGFTDADLAAAEGGAIVTRALPGRMAGDVAVAGLLYIQAPMELLLEPPAETRLFLTVGEAVQFGLFSDPPSRADVDGLRFDPRELEQARGCEPRDCSLKLDRLAMERLERWDRRSPEGDRGLADLLKESMLETVAAYRRDGSLPVYLDKKRPISVAEELRSSVEGSPYIDGRSPFLQYVLDYPRASLADTRDVFYWSSETLRRPIVSVHHLAIHRGRDGDAFRYAIADKHLSDNHYFRARLELVWLLPGRDPSGFYCVRLSRARIDPPGWFTGIAMGKVRRATRRSLDRQLGLARGRIEASARRAATAP